MRGLYLFVAGILVGLAVQMAIAQNHNRGIVGLNHVGISVPNLHEAVTYYTETMGFPEAFRIVDETGQPALVSSTILGILTSWSNCMPGFPLILKEIEYPFNRMLLGHWRE